jgi:hypothetical protein
LREQDLVTLAPGLEEQRFKGKLSVCCAPGEVTRKRRRGREEEEQEQQEEEDVGESAQEEEEAFDLDHVMSLVCSREGFGVCTMMKRGKNHRTK